MELAAFVDGDVKYVGPKGGLGELSYLERREPTAETLIVFLHGLGLDAYDYLPFLKTHEIPGIAINLHGFDERVIGPIPPMTLEQHVKLVSNFIKALRPDHYDKRIILVGFSLGADLILRLGEYWHDYPDERAPLDSVVLLDPNVNHSTMTISSIFAKAPSDTNTFAPAVKQLIADLPDTDDALVATICEYIGRIGGKDFTHIRRLSQDAVDYWEETGYEQFRHRLKRVGSFATSVRVLLSGPYECHREHLLTSEPDQTIEIEIRKGTDHFDLVRSQFLYDELRPLLGLRHQHCVDSRQSRHSNHSHSQFLGSGP